MIASGIEAAHVEVPVIVGEEQQVRLGEPALSGFKAQEQCLVHCGNLAVKARSRWFRPNELLVDADDAIRVAGAVHGAQPFALEMPRIQPRGSVCAAGIELRVFPDFERKAGGPIGGAIRYRAVRLRA